MGPRFLPLAASVVTDWCDRLRLPVPVAPAGDPGATGWRLVSLSNRELGRGVVLDSPAAVLATTEALRSRAADLSLQLVQADHGTWVWLARLDGTVVAASPRAYRRRRECALRAARFIEILPGARTAGPDASHGTSPAVAGGTPA